MAEKAQGHVQIAEWENEEGDTAQQLERFVEILRAFKSGTDDVPEKEKHGEHQGRSHSEPAVSRSVPGLGGAAEQRLRKRA